MAGHDSLDTDRAKDLLARTLQDPLGLDSPDHVAEWLGLLRTHFPLWAFQAFAYMELNRLAKEKLVEAKAEEVASVGEEMPDVETDADVAKLKKFLRIADISSEIAFLSWGALPSAYPLQMMVNSILDDEVLLWSLGHCVDVRRKWLVSGFTSIPPENPDWSADPRSHSFVFQDFSASFEADQVDAAQEYNADDPQPYQSSYEDVGRKFVEEVEKWISARDKTERAEHHKKLHEFPRRIAAELGVFLGGRGRLPEGPRPDILEAIVTQGRSLIELCWDLFPVTVNDQTAELLASQGEFENHQLWCARLSLPILSKPEILALRSEAEKARRLTTGAGERPTALRFTIWVVAHRLRLSAPTTARKALHTDAPQYFVDRSNPIDVFQ